MCAMSDSSNSRRIIQIGGPNAPRGNPVYSVPLQTTATINIQLGGVGRTNAAGIGSGTAIRMGPRGSEMVSSAPSKGILKSGGAASQLSASSQSGVYGQGSRQTSRSAAGTLASGEIVPQMAPVVQSSRSKYESGQVENAQLQTSADVHSLSSRLDGTSINSATYLTAAEAKAAAIQTEGTGNLSDVYSQRAGSSMGTQVDPNDLGTLRKPPSESIYSSNQYGTSSNVGAGSTGAGSGIYGSGSTYGTSQAAVGTDGIYSGIDSQSGDAAESPYSAGSLKSGTAGSEAGVYGTGGSVAGGSGTGVYGTAGSVAGGSGTGVYGTAGSVAGGSGTGVYGTAGSVAGGSGAGGSGVGGSGEDSQIYAAAQTTGILKSSPKRNSTAEESNSEGVYGGSDSGSKIDGDGDGPWMESAADPNSFRFIGWEVDPDQEEDLPCKRVLVMKEPDMVLMFTASCQTEAVGNNPKVLDLMVSIADSCVDRLRVLIKDVASANIAAENMDTLPLSDGRHTKEHLEQISKELNETVAITDVAFRFQPPDGTYLGTFVQGTVVAKRNYAIGKVGVVAVLTKKSKFATVEAFSEQLCEHIARTKPANLGTMRGANTKHMTMRGMNKLQEKQRNQLLLQNFIFDQTIVVAEAARRSFCKIDGFLLFK